MIPRSSMQSNPLPELKLQIVEDVSDQEDEEDDESHLFQILKKLKEAKSTIDHTRKR